MSEAEARREEHEALAHHFPVLAGLTPDEFDRFVDAAVSRAGLQRTSDLVGRWVAMLGVLFAAVVVFIATSLGLRAGLLWIGPAPRALAVSIAGVAALGILWTWRNELGRARAKAERRLRVMAVHNVLLAGPACAGCGYALDELPPADERPGVVRCPECGLVNPGPPDAAAVSR